MPWLVTWEASVSRRLPAKRIAAVLDGRSSAARVRQIVEILYATHCYTERELVSFSRTGNPYPAVFDEIKGVLWEGQVICGHNPYLRARKVDKLKWDDALGATWIERKKPKISHAKR